MINNNVNRLTATEVKYITFLLNLDGSSKKIAAALNENVNSVKGITYDALAKVRNFDEVCGLEIDRLNIYPGRKEKLLDALILGGYFFKKEVAKS